MPPKPMYPAPHPKPIEHTTATRTAAHRTHHPRHSSEITRETFPASDVNMNPATNSSQAEPPKPERNEEQL